MANYYDEEFESRCATEAEADAEYARNVGHDHPERAWILSDRDVWYANPFYQGVPQPHPEDYDHNEDDYVEPVSDSDRRDWEPDIDEAQEWADFDPDC